ncbi:MAG: anti-sigma factor family protein [Ornithinibacter sp.]
MTDGMRVQCRGEELTEYAAGRLPLDRQWAWDRHLVACQLCAQEVAQERRLRSALAGAPSMPGDLRSSLLALGAALATDLGPRPAPSGHEQLALLHPSAPPCHRSALRATVVAAAAAGLSAAAAWSLTVAPPVGARSGLATANAPVVSPVVAPTRADGGTMSITQVRLTRTVVVDRLGERAESTP